MVEDVTKGASKGASEQEAMVEVASANLGAGSGASDPVPAAPPSADEVISALRSAFHTARAAGASFPAHTWERARFVDAERAERSGRVVVAAARTWAWGERPQRAAELRPYGVHQHTILVGVAPASEGISVDLTRFGEVGW